MPRYFLGVDGGQSSTTALVGDETGRVVGVGRGGPCNHVGAAEGHAKFTRTLGDCLRQACGEKTIEFEAACLGFSGGPADKEEIVRRMVRAGKISVTVDALIALAGATGGEPGIIVIAGTGSIAFGRNTTGETARAGGWGYVFGDEGGAFDIVRQALRAALRIEEGWGPGTVLRGKLLAETGAPNVNSLMHQFYTKDYPRSRVAGYARLVDDAARAGDAVAAKIIDEAARQLSVLAYAVRAQIFKAGEPSVVSYAGGVFSSERLLGRFAEFVKPIQGAKFLPPVHEPAIGALLEAYRLAGLTPKISEPPVIES